MLIRNVSFAALALIANAAAVHVLGLQEANVEWVPLVSFQESLGPWRTITNMVMDDATSNALRPDDYLSRSYEADSNAVNVFIAYFRSMRNGAGPHSPEVCLPGAGWKGESKSTVEVSRESSTPLTVNRYVLRKSASRILTLYWYQTRRRTYAEEFSGKLYSPLDLWADRRSDGCLVRLITSFPENAEAAAERRIKDLAIRVRDELHAHLRQEL